MSKPKFCEGDRVTRVRNPTGQPMTHAEIVAQVSKYPRLLRLDASGENGRMLPTEMYALADLLAALQDSPSPNVWCINPELHAEVGHIAACFIDPKHGQDSPSPSETGSHRPQCASRWCQAPTCRSEYRGCLHSRLACNCGTPSPSGSTEQNTEALIKIANLAWRGYSASHECREIYEVCRDELQVTAGSRAPADRQPSEKAK